MKVLLPLAAALLLAACSAPPPPAAGPRAVLVQSVAATDAAGLRAYTGEVRPRIESALGFRVGGRLLERVDLGTRVQPGQRIARLDPADVELGARAAQAQLASAEAGVALARAEWERAQGLQNQAFISASALDGRRTALAAAEAALAQARAQADLAGRQRAYADLLADRAGVVTAVRAEPGQVLEQGEPVLLVAPEGEREVLIHLPENALAGIAPGSPAQVRPWGVPEPLLPARVREVAPAADAASRTYAVRVAVTGAPPQLPLGSTATVLFAAAGVTAQPVPLRALGQRDGRPVVWVVGEDQRVQPRPVELLGYQDEVAVLKGGVQPGERLVVAGIHLLQAGERVRPLAESAPVALDVQR